MSTPVETALDTEAAESTNPFLQFVDPARYRKLVELANKRTQPGRVICLSGAQGPPVLGFIHAPRVHHSNG